MKYIMMPDKYIRSGSAPVYNDQNQVIATIHYQYFSFKRKLHITNSEGEMISRGNIRMFSFRPTWLIYDQYDQNIGRIKQLFTFFSRKFIYQNNKGVEYRIDGNIFGRNFKVYDNYQTILEVTSTSNIISLRPHNYLVKIMDDRLDTYEVINIVSGIRNLVELSKSRN